MTEQGRRRVRVQFIGTGDAFGSGGRLNTCFHVTGERVNFLIDCGASSLIGLKASGIRRNDIQAIFLTHFHADHFGGIPFFMLDAQFFSRRAEPLALVGPPGLVQWYERVMETSFPGSSRTQPKFPLSLVEIRPGERLGIAGVQVQPFQAVHGDPGGACLVYRLEAEGRTIAYTGDTEWTDAIVEAGSQADLLIAEAYFFDRKVRFHLDLAALVERLPAIRPKRLVLTHMSEEMLGRLGEVPQETAHDGMVLEL